MEKREVILIGGHFHRQKVLISPSQQIIRMAVQSKITDAFFYNDQITFDVPNHNIEEYTRIYSILGEVGIFPEDCFFYKKLDLIKFLKSLVYDYVY